jgi:hypothetical protein
MKKNIYFLAVSLFLLVWNELPAQTAAEAMMHPVISKYYTAEQLQYLEQHDTTELKSIIYYFTQSFTVIPVQCDDCLPFDSLAFDITKFEHLRLANETYIRTFDKYGFKLILKPVSEMPYYYDIQHVAPVGPGKANEPH